MKVLVAGASGLIGGRVARSLVAAGHEVSGTTRRAGRVAQLEDAGIAGVVMDALDQESVRRAIGRISPAAVIHELTDLSDLDVAANARLREEGTANLVHAAREHGVERMVAQSISWAYEPGPTPATEEEPFAQDPIAGLCRFASIEALEHTVLELPEGVVLRYGLFYGPGTWYAIDGPQTVKARAGVVEATTAWTSFVHVDDAATATVDALGWPHGVVNIVDDEPTHVDEWGPLYVEAAGGAPTTISARTEGRSADNRRARALGWVPAHPSWRTSLLGEDDPAA